MHEIIRFVPKDMEDNPETRRYPAICVGVAYSMFQVEVVKFDGELVQAFSFNDFGLAVAQAGIMMSNIPLCDYVVE